MSDKGKRPKNEPDDDGWAPPWTFGVEGEAVDGPAWEFTESLSEEESESLADEAADDEDALQVDDDGFELPEGNADKIIDVHATHIRKLESPPDDTRPDPPISAEAARTPETQAEPVAEIVDSEIESPDSTGANSDESQPVSEPDFEAPIAEITFDTSEPQDQVHESGEIDASMSATTDANPFFDPESVPAELPVATIAESPLSAIETQVLPSFEIVSVESGTDLPPSDLPEPPLVDSSIASSEVRIPDATMIEMPEERHVEPVSIAGAEESLESNEKTLIEVIAESKETAQDSAQKPADDFEFMIEFENVTKRFRNQTVLRDLTFRVPRGQTVCLIGESGCGKTVNLKLMIGLMRPDQGRVSFKGEDLARMNEKKITATRIKFGFLFQMAALFDSMSIYDNVAFGLREHRLVDEKDLPDYIRERLTEVGLPQGVESKKPAELSGGQRKRVGLARALALKPEVMLYDEPTTGLDPIMTDIINELILQTQADRSRSGIIVTHEMRTVTKCADRVIMLYPISRLEPDEPQILYDGPADGLEDHPDVRVRQFVRGEAGERLRELNPDRLSEDPASGIVPMDPDEIVKARPPRRN